MGGLDAKFQDLNLSAGQKQLVAIVRAMVHHIHMGTKIAFFDEVTSHLDRTRDRMVQELIAEIFAGCTMLVVAHRDEIVRHMDTIVDVSRGRVVMFKDRGRPPPYQTVV